MYAFKVFTINIIYFCNPYVLHLLTVIKSRISSISKYTLWKAIFVRERLILNDFSYGGRNSYPVFSAHAHCIALVWAVTGCLHVYVLTAHAQLVWAGSSFIPLQ